MSSIFCSFSGGSGSLNVKRFEFENYATDSINRLEIRFISGRASGCHLRNYLSNNY